MAMNEQALCAAALGVERPHRAARSAAGGGPRGGDGRDRGPFAGASRAACGPVAGCATRWIDSPRGRFRPHLPATHIWGLTTTRPSHNGARSARTRVSTGPYATGTTNGTGSFYRARYYDPLRSRFVSADPLWPIGGINTYTYVLDNPVRYVDSTGQVVEELIIWALILSLLTEATLPYWLQEEEPSKHLEPNPCVMPKPQDYSEWLPEELRELYGSKGGRLGTRTGRGSPWRHQVPRR